MKNRNNKKHTQLAATETFREPIFRESVNCKIHCTPFILIILYVYPSFKIKIKLF